MVLPVGHQPATLGYVDSHASGFLLVSFYLRMKKKVREKERLNYLIDG